VSHPNPQQDFHHSLVPQVVYAVPAKAMEPTFHTPHLVQYFVQTSPQNVGSRKWFSTLFDGLSLAHPFISDQWKGGPGGCAHLIKAPEYLMDMHFEGNAPGAGLTGLVLHMAGTVKDIANGNASQERGLS
jgi:hypothetical protein